MSRTTRRHDQAGESSRTLYLHVGTHKTGTSAIQAMLERCRGEIAAQGMTIIDAHVPDLKRALRPQPQDRRSESVHRARRLLSNRILQSRIRNARHFRNRTFLLSWEGLCGTPIEGYAESGDTAAIIQAALNGWCTIKAVFFLRRQDLFAESMYAQYIRQGMSFSFSEFMKRLPERAFDWKRLVDSYADQIGKENITVVPYEKEILVNSDSILQIFCRQVGLNPDQIDFKLPTSSSGRPNQGWPIEGLQLASLCADSLSEEPRRALRQLLDQVNLRSFHRTPLMSAGERQALLSDYEASNRLVLETYLNGSRPTLFSAPPREPAEAAPQEREQPCADAELRLLGVLIAHLANNQRPRTIVGNLVRRLLRQG